MIYVVDASVAIRWLLADQQHPHAQAVLERIVAKPHRFVVPELFPFEVYAVLCRLHPQPLAAFSRGILPLLQGGIMRHPMTHEIATAAMPLVQAGLSGYDASYAALAALLDGTWLTFDRKAHARLGGRGLSHPLWDDLPPQWD